MKKKKNKIWAGKNTNQILDDAKKIVGLLRSGVNATPKGHHQKGGCHHDI